MAKKNTMSEERREYLKEYRKANLKRLPLDLDLETFARFKSAAKAANKPVSKILKEYIVRYIDASGY